MLAKKFEELIIWKLSREIVRDIYSDFKHVHDYSFKNQITSAGISIMNNIAEGYSRESNSEFRYFLNISKASAGEVKSMYYVAEDLNYLSPETANVRRNHIESTKNMIAKFRNSLK